MDIKTHLAGVLSDAELDFVTRSYDVIGDIFITTIAPELEHKEHIIGQMLLDMHPHVKVAAKRLGKYSGEFRTRTLAVIGGEKRLTTLHKENTILLKVDLQKMYFTARLAGERMRVAAMVKPGELVGVFGSGAGPFPLTIARHSDPARVIGIEKNPAAHEYALLNQTVNKAEEKVCFIQGDAAQVIRDYRFLFDRVITMLPTQHKVLLEPALSSLTPGGVLHHYAMVEQNDTSTVAREIQTACAKKGLAASDITPQRCGHCTPTTDRYCFTVQLL
ncbi:MAG: hypothetical protein CSB34_05755 [Desulfobulbus propionicus]|nr:MAG: hypothetical protein CSB34_05755 [Desulfobulbus propionicus]